MGKKRIRFSIEIPEKAKHILIKLGYMDKRGKCKAGKSVGKLLIDLLYNQFDNKDMGIAYLQHLIRVENKCADKCYDNSNMYNMQIDAKRKELRKLK